MSHDLANRSPLGRPSPGGHEPERVELRPRVVVGGADADFGRAYLPRDRLTPLAAYDVPGQRVTEDTDVKHTTVWTLAERSG